MKKKAAPSIPGADDLACKYCVFCFPLADGNAHPKAVDAKRDNAQYPPLYPQEKQAERSSCEVQTLAFYDGMVGFPSIYHADGPWVADAKGEDGD